VWHCNPDPGPQPAVGTVCNPPANGQSVPHYQPVSSSAAVLTVNSTGAIPCGGWACRHADGTQAGNRLTNDLMEGGVDLLQLGFTGCISSFLPHTRSAQSFTATLKDFALVRFNTCGNPHIVTTVNPASGPVGTTLNDTAVLSGTVGGTGTI